MATEKVEHCLIDDTRKGSMREVPAAREDQEFTIGDPLRERQGAVGRADPIVVSRYYQGWATDLAGTFDGLDLIAW